MPILSLPNEFGIGSLGIESYQFVDYLASLKIKYWQILPISETTYGDSPYQSPSAYAGNPYYIDLLDLVKEKLINIEELSDYKYYSNPRKVDYLFLYQTRCKVLALASSRFDYNDVAYVEFTKRHSYWLDNYSLFMSIHKYFKGTPLQSFDKKILDHDKETIEYYSNILQEDINYYKFVQYIFFKQYFALKKYANSKGIKIIGDMPIYVATDSADVFKDPRYFQLNSNYQPEYIAGCPPDMFSKDGQLWGNVLYNWEELEKDNFVWWEKRIEFMLLLYDKLRIDHFIGFRNYYSIQADASTAKDGKWIDAPGVKLFDFINKRFNHPDIIAEDLGEINDKVREMLKSAAYPGMYVMHFDYGRVGEFINNSVTYTSTHDSDTSYTWYQNRKFLKKFKVRKFLKCKLFDKMPEPILLSALRSNSDIVIIPYQDYLGLDNSARINCPGTIGTNWQYRFIKSDFNEKQFIKIREILDKGGR